MRRSSVCIVAASLACLSSVHAEEADRTESEADLRLAPVNVSGLRAVSPGDVTGSVSVLDAADLRVRDQPYLADQLRVVPGVAVSRSGAVGALTQIRIRGSEANHTLVLLDGIELSDPTTGETDFGLLSGLYPARIEIARGEQSALFGADAIGGVINIISARTNGVQGQVELGSHDTRRLDLAVGQALTAGHISVAVANSRTEGVDTSGTGGETDGAQASSIMMTGQLDLAEVWRLSGLVRFGQSRTDNDSDRDFDGLLDDTAEDSRTDQWTMGAALSGTASGVDHQLRLAWSDIDRSRYAAGRLEGQTLGQRLKWAYSPAHSITVGEGTLDLAGLVDWEREDYERAKESTLFGDPNQTQRFETLGLAGQARLSVNRLSLEASLRQENHDGGFDEATTWRIGGAWRALPGGKLRASAGSGVKNPTFTELFGFFPGSFVGNPDLAPEQSTSWEMGWDQTHDRVVWSVSYFEAELEDEIFTAFNQDGTSTARNRTGRSERSGLEAALTWSLSDQVSLGASASRIESTNDTGTAEIRVPDWTGGVQLAWDSGTEQGIRAGLAADYVGAQGDFDFGSFRRVELDPYWLVSATIDLPVSDRVSLTLRGTNLLDQTTTDVFGYQQPGAGLLFGLRVR